MEERIRNAVAAALSKVGAEDTRFSIERPGDAAHGDYATNAAMAAGKPLGKNPKALADELVPHIQDALEGYAESVSVAGPGFINVKLSAKTVRAALEEALEEGEAWGKGSEGEGTRVMVEYTDPNPFKEMHIGHLMSNVIGEAVARLAENSGAAIARACYQGDVGPHVAKALWRLRQTGITEPSTAAEIGKAYADGSKAYEESAEAKAEIDLLNVAVYKGEDAELMELWRKGREVSLAAFEEAYKTLGTKFDYYFFESETSGPGTSLVHDALAKGIFRESEGAVIYPGEEKGLHTLVFLTSKGTPTYEAKELGLAFAKEERWPSDHSYILTAAEQVGHFKVALAALSEIAPPLAAKTRHIPHGFLRLTSGKMSSREGNVITATMLVNDMVAKALEKNPDPLVAEEVAIGAVKYMILRQAAGGDIIFDPEKSLSLDGDSGPYLQYALVRARKILTYEGEGGGETPAEPYAIERLIIRYPEVTRRARAELAPHHVAQYLTELAGAWNAFYATEQVLGSPEEAYKQKIAKAFLVTMENGLRLLGIPAPEKM